MSVLWFDARQVSIDAWFAQSFLIHSFSFMESSVLPAMTFDYVAIYYLLRYSSMLTSARIDRIRLVSWAGPGVSSSIPPLLE